MSTTTPLFRDRTVRSVTSAALAAFAAHFLTRMIPNTMHTYNLMQSSVAMLALASLSILVVMHHRRNGQFLTQTQEEIILIAAFGFFWLAILVAWRAFTAQPGHGELAPVPSTSHSRRPTAVSGRREPGFTRTARRQYGCTDDSWYCVVDEYSWY
ncbi:hypothetical protein DAEQUDRAFT_720583 [Daedalea quercina L-15889]|uniref:Uncharacterized protein n=1 Tax=Daedalea quercina L-15889 TaxID=1314783 RepID=A0A165U5F0_9APHY|nr:hypothetical protein DAEQUDRAFT_720583 [Daedalea quercina L-15889]